MGTTSCSPQSICGTSHTERPDYSNWNVVIDHDVDVMDCKTGKRGSVSLGPGTVHGKIRSNDLDPDSVSDPLWSCLPDGQLGNPIALEIVEHAIRMANKVSQEEDMLDMEWTGPNGKEPLGILFGTQNSEGIARSFLELVTLLQVIVKKQPSLNCASVPTKIFGDLHGQFRDMLLLLHYYGFPTATGPEYVFNGDWVDRGKHQLETVSLVFALKVAFPDKVWLNRGNHEEESQNRHMREMGFEHACLQHFGLVTGKVLFASCARLFEYLPLGTVIANRILVVHGGIGDGCWDLEVLAAADRPLNKEKLTQNEVLYNVLWSDPIEDDDKTQPTFGVHDSPRDNHQHLIKTFGNDVTKRFCKRNGLAMIIRSHEADYQGHGYEVMHDEHLIRVFSARDYANGGQMNDGSILSIAHAQGSLLVTPQMLQSLLKRR